MKLLDLYNEIKILSPQNLPNKIINLYQETLNKIWDIEDSITQMNTELELVSIIEDYFPGYGQDELFPDGWYKLLEELNNIELNNILKRIQKINLDI